MRPELTIHVAVACGLASLALGAGAATLLRNNITLLIK